MTIQVLRGNQGSLLSYKTALALGILNLHINQIKESSLSHDIEKKFPDLFNCTSIAQLSLSHKKHDKFLFTSERK